MCYRRLLISALGLVNLAILTPSNVVASAPKATELELAAKLTERIEDADFRAQIDLSLVEFQIAQGQLKAAKALAATMPDYRRGVALAKVAAAFGRAGKGEETSKLIGETDVAERFPHAWQGDAVRAEVAIAWAAADRGEEAEAVAGKLTDEAARIRARTGIALEQARREQPFDGGAFQFSADQTKPVPERLQAARTLLEIAEVGITAAAKKGASLDTFAPLLNDAEAILKATRVAAGEEYLDLGLLWRRIGESSKSAELLGQAFRQMPPGARLEDWRAGYFAKLVRTYGEAGEQAAVEKMLAAAQQSVLPLHRFYQPPALCQLAEAELAAGHPEKANEAWLQATRIARENPNPSSQYVGCAQVALSVARARQPLAPKLKQELRAQLAGARSKTPLVGN